MGDPSHDDLRHLLRDAVADVAPHDRLGEIRRETRRKAPRVRRRWGTVVLGAGVATAAVVGAVALVGGLGLPGESGDPAGPPRSEAVAAYFVGDTPLGPRLFREFQAVPRAEGTEDRALAALRLLEVDEGAEDPDYDTSWPDGSFTAVRSSSELIEVVLRERPVPLPGAAGIQQAVLTVQAAYGATLPVAFTTPEGPLEPGDGAAVGRDNRLLAPVNITDPAEGHAVGDRLTIRGTIGPAGAGQDGTDDVGWELRTDDDSVAASGSIPLDRLSWEDTVDIAAVHAGSYLLVVTVGTPAGPATDTRTLTVR